jgi:hypothetical protein
MSQSKELYDKPSEVEAKQGNVEVEGPDKVNIAMTPDAAEETSDRLTQKALKARGQRRLKHLPHQPKD